MNQKGILRQTTSEADELCSECSVVIPAGTDHWEDDVTFERFCTRCYELITTPDEEDPGWM